MPSWSKRDQRQYEHIKESSEERGVPEQRAEEIAARTVNKQRRQEGRTRTAPRRAPGTRTRPWRNARGPSCTIALDS
jgi:hypothetical protein